MPTDLPEPGRRDLVVAQAVGAAPGRGFGYLSRRGTGKLNANRKEEDLQLNDSVGRPSLVSLCFLLTSDIILVSAMEEDPAPLPLALSTVPRGHLPLPDYLPAILTPAQESYIKHWKAQVLDAVDKEYSAFLEERATEILALRKAIVEEDAQMDTRMDVEDAEKKPDEPPKCAGADVEMDMEDADGDRDRATPGTAASTKEMAEEMKKEKEELPVVPADGDDAVEY
ncbi:hypothetical protein K438DRAFT_1996220 [Mycena galopus ATCC 62051]|nr:hypothetical protein K438DRAFT_1996220 [Mycena galopus ATCC 62051]